VKGRGERKNRKNQRKKSKSKSKQLKCVMVIKESAGLRSQGEAGGGDG